ncbi:MAG: hypothetical protein NC206_03990 [Bacteroides sp.]|nr:hypothetical protein [Roseburia sp.]MCM1346228.1 hypothetical protein [Bacteroides sp.]MCM1420705.1 hypothetical protein [Bacteroides sp.]
MFQLNPASIISYVTVVVAFVVQIAYFAGNLKKLSIVCKFFNKNREYAVCGEDENSRIDASVADSGSHLYSLITELNEYTRKNHGTTDFSVIQNKTDRKINVLYDDATSKIAFPTYIGLMGTFFGVLIGLIFFNNDISSSSNGEGITDETIGNLIFGVLVSMATSFIGLLFTTITHHYASETQKIVGKEKNDFYEFIQNELMPTLGVSMVAALNKLHHTINLFEPSFNRVINKFQITFDTCTQRFGNAFEKNVTIVSEAVSVMGKNMDKINENINLQAQLLETLRSGEIIGSLDAFVRASKNFALVTNAINRFENDCNAINGVTVELVNTQQRYNESLEIPLSVANKLNQILSRVTDFEKSINTLGRNIEKIDLIGNTEVEALKEVVKVIKDKQKIAFEAMQVSDGHLEDMFKIQNDAICKLNKAYEENLATYALKFENVLEGLGKEMLERRREIVSAIEEKFSLEQIQQDFSQLSKLKKIEELLTSINTNSSREDVDKILETTRAEVQQIRHLLDKIIKESQKKPELQSGASFLGGLFGRNK